MDMIVDWLYADFRETVTFAQRVDLYRASHKFNIPELEAECVRVLASAVSVETFPVVMRLAAEHGCQKLEQVTILVLKEG